MIYINDIINRLSKIWGDDDKIKYHINITKYRYGLMNNLLELDLKYENKLFIPSDKIDHTKCMAYYNNEGVECKRPRIHGSDYCIIHIKHVNKYDFSLPMWGRIDFPRMKYNFKDNKTDKKMKNWCGDCDIKFDKKKKCRGNDEKN